jgi:CHAT domain-containing protein
VTARADEFRAAADRVSATLGWLCDAIAGPILEAIGLDMVPAEGARWPRLWWVPTGPLAFLPLHAAGHHDEAGATVPRSVLDRVASEVLVVAMPSTPSARDLECAQEEADDIADRLADVDILSGGEATHAAVLAALPAHPWVHFACHAESSTDDATAARLLLADHEDHPLTVREIAGLRIPRAELAYLSACDTARGPVKLADEAVHVTGAFHVAGYAHVTGTLWSVADDLAAEVARDIYAIREWRDR